MKRNVFSFSLKMCSDRCSVLMLILCDFCVMILCVFGWRWLQLVASSRAAVVIHCTELSRVVASDLSLSLGTSHTLVNAVLAAAAVSRCVSLPVTVALWSTDAICWCWRVALCWAAPTVSAVFPVSSNSVFLTDFWCFNSSWLHVETEICSKSFVS